MFLGSIHTNTNSFPYTVQMESHALLKKGRYYNTTMRHYWDMSVK